MSLRQSNEDEHALLRRYGLDPDPRADEILELELADRLTDQASLPPGDAGARALAHQRLRGGADARPDVSSPPVSPGPGERVVYRGEDGAGPDGPGTVRALLDEEEAAAVAFDHGGESAVSLQALEQWSS
jgi:hypothetical protein